MEKLPLFEPPRCVECGLPMRLLTVEPHSLLKLIDIESYECVCGASGQFSVARVLHRPS